MESGVFIFPRKKSNQELETTQKEHVIPSSNLELFGNFRVPTRNSKKCPGSDWELGKI